MGRSRGFTDDEVLEAAADVFVSGGYEGTSIDDLVKALNLHRGSLYNAFGSKRGLFLAVLRHYVDRHLMNLHPPGLSATDAGDSGGLTNLAQLDLLLIAAVERGHRDSAVAGLVRRGLQLIEEAIDDPDDAPTPDAVTPPLRAVNLLGARLYERLFIGSDELPATQQANI